MKITNIWIISLFPEIIENYFSFGVIQRAKSFSNIISINPREFSNNNYQSVDDYPFGGGAGMIIKPDVLKSTLKGICEVKAKSCPIFSKKWEQFIQSNNSFANFFKSSFNLVYTAPFGTTWNQLQAKELSKNIADVQNQEYKEVIFLCGRYEGVDQRFIDLYIHKVFSLGDFIITGGELAVLTILDSTLRLIPKVIGNEESLIEESFENNLLEGPQYTRPRVFDDVEVPEILLSGHHKNIENFKMDQKLHQTKINRPDLLLNSHDEDKV
jgi:tRNA (guanine37-N1)-methyltransferase